MTLITNFLDWIGNCFYILPCEDEYELQVTASKFHKANQQGSQPYRYYCHFEK